MITKKEVRIGNLIYLLGYDFNEGGRFLDGTKEVELVDLDTLKNIIVENNVYEGILLSEEWLLKLGFEKENGSHIYKKENLKIDWFNCPLFRFKAECDNYEMKFFEFRTLHYVHELQNLYYVLTGQELLLSAS